MRRPPDKDGHSAMTERDVVSSNATLNAFLGGSRQKPWMLAGGASVRPTPRRPSITTPSDQSNSNNTQRGSTANLLSPVTSNESSSPGLANNHTPLHTPHPAAVSGTHGSPRGNAAIATSQALQDAYTTPSNTDIVQPQLSPDASRGEVDEPRTVAVSARSPSEEAPQLQTPANIASTQRSTNDIPCRQSSDQNRGNQTPPVTTGNSASSRTMQGTVDQASFSHAQSHPRRALPPTMPSLKPRVALLKSYIEHCGGMANLNSALEKPRFSLMETACNAEDAFYVALHQLFCTWDTSRRDITGLPGLPDSATLALAFRILGQLIRDNEAMAPAHLRWFAKFPSPLVDLVTNSQPYRRTIREVGIFLSNLASDWPNLTKLCAVRGHPPLVDELVNRLGLLSPTLQNIVFTAMRRNLNIVDNEFGNQMERVFEQDRTEHRELAARYNTSHPPSEREIKERTKIIVDKYMMISQKLRQKKQMAPQPSTTAPAPVPSSNTFGTGQIPVTTNGPYSYPNRPASNLNQSASRQQNDAPNRQIGQNLGQIRTSFTGPPLLSTMTSAIGSHPNIAPRANADTPSPIPMQGLSMGSPMQHGFPYSSPVLQSNGTQFPSPVLRNNGTQSPTIIAQNQGLPQGQHYYDPRFDPRQQAHYPQQLLQQQFGQQGQYGTNNPQQASFQQIQQAQMQQQQQQQWLQHSSVLPHNPQHHTLQQQISQQQTSQHHTFPRQISQHQIPQQQQAFAMQHRPHLRRDSNLGNGQQQQQQISPRNVSRNGSRNNSVSSEHVLPLANGSVPMQHFPQGMQIPPCPRPIPIEEQRRIHYRMSDPLKRPIIPPLGFVHPQTIPDPDSNTLHQSHVRSPRLVTVDVPKLGGDDTSRRFYQFVKDFPMAPRKIPFELTLNKFTFQVPTDALTHISRDRLIGTDPLTIREVRSKSLQFRLRCVSTAVDTEEFPVPSWVISDTVWPEMIFMDINSNDYYPNTLEIRRKMHHGKDLPIDITPYIRAGTNEITISMPKLTTAIKQREYFVAVEEIEILQHDEIMDMCKEQSISAATVVEEIKKKLAGPTEEDDELLIMASDLSIDLTDPFTTRIFEIPVRGKDCLHRECFDLATFLLTRVSKPKRPEQPSLVDGWKCPLCFFDARPYSLQYDEFLASVREKLQKQDNLDVKSILVTADGTWRPKPELHSSHKRKSTTGGDGDDDDDSIDEDRPSKKSTHGVKTSVVEIIDLDDD
ncbi:hypothetical protein SBOR_5184 [Sclerotinia borealis F-4128]|uniref:SP-RING-type domain-containing protein n=1 Tax=Sclerotinia borealis (strain F-4128) TaxID=1432307 RepID=W9CF24_SCLBF|nr:hypothetical protein SBOR_5184 [Sclerotinia borealis F-4128]